MPQKKTSKLSLEINEDMAFQKRSWIVERAGWVVMAVLLLCTAAGLFGGGPLSWAEQSDRLGMMSVSYSHFQRQDADWEMTVHVSPGTMTAGEFAVEFDAAFLQAFEIRTVRPDPEKSVAHDGGVRMHFAAQAGGPAAIVMKIRPQSVGFIEPKIALMGAEPITLSILVYP